MRWLIAVGVVLLGIGGGAQDITSEVRSDVGNKYKGDFLPCGTTRSKDTYDKELARIGWASPRHLTIDWSRELVIVVSPEQFKKDAYLAFAGTTIDRAAKTMTVRWRLKTSVPSASRDANSATSGSSAPPAPQILVVVVPASRATGLQVKCVEVN